jgi:hypothetical protein
VKSWEVKAARKPCCRWIKRPLGTVLADTSIEALRKGWDLFEAQLADDEEVCVGMPQNADAWQLVLEPQV